MELEYLVLNLSFADNEPFAYPAATVRVLPAGRSKTNMSAAFIDLKVKLPDTVPSGADPSAVAAAAVSAARAMIQPSAVAAHLQTTLDREAQLQRDADARMAAIFQPPAA